MSRQPRSTAALSAASYADTVGSNDRVRVAFLGCGGRAQAHIDLVNKFTWDGKPVAARPAGGRSA